MQCQCDRKTLTNDERVRIWKEAVVCSFMALRVGMLEKTQKYNWVILIHHVAVIPNNSLFTKQSGRTNASIAIVSVYVADKCHAIS